MEKTKITRTASTRQDLRNQRDALVAEIRFRPANGLPAREGTGLGGRFLSAAEVAERSAAISRLNAAIKAAEADELAAARARQAQEDARRWAALIVQAEWERSPAGRCAMEARARRAAAGQRKAVTVVAAYRAATPAARVRTDRRAQKAAVNGWDALVGNYGK